MLPAVVLSLALSGAVPAEASRGKPSPRTVSLSPETEAALRLATKAEARFGGVLLRARNPHELQEALSAMVVTPEFSETFAQLLRVAPVFRRLWSELPADAVARSVQRVVPENLRPKVLQAIAINAELIQRLPSPPQPVSMTSSDISAEILSDDSARQAVEGIACGFAVGLFFHPDGASDEVKSAIVDRWYDTMRKLRREIDPLQAQLDAAVDAFPSPVREAVMRVAYAWDIDASGEPCLIVWLVVRDENRADVGSVGGNIELMRPIAEALSTSVPFFLRLRMASEPSWP